MSHLAGHYYHVYNRGCNRENIFLTEDNYQYLLRQVKRILPESRVSIIAYCLMPNHYHFLLRSGSDDAIGRFMRRLFSGYTQAFKNSTNAAAPCLKAERKASR